MNEFDDPFGLHGQSRPSGRFDENGREIRLVGAPLLAWNPATNNLSVPEEHREHAMIRGQYFYTLPLNVLNTVVEVVGMERFDADLLQVERELSNVCGDHVFNVGFWNNIAIPYRELKSNGTQPFSDEMIRESGYDTAAVELAMRTYHERDVAPLERFARGFCGWLMTNRRFLDEHDELLANHAETVRRWGTYQAATFLPESYRLNLIPGTDPNEDPLWQQFIADCNPFLIRWRLAGLSGPYLPVPSKPLMAGAFPLSVVGQLMGAGGVFFIPDTMPIPSRDHLRGMLDQALHRNASVDHLDEWFNFVRADNSAKNQMDPFVRRFELQHYWRILHQRHADAISGKIGVIEDAFGTMFKVGSQLIHSDLIEIRKRLGKDWLDRGKPI